MGGGEWVGEVKMLDKDRKSRDIFLRAYSIKDGSGNIIVSDSDHLVALVGCDDLVVVHTDDATLVCPKGESQRIKELVKRLGANEADRKLL